MTPSLIGCEEKLKRADVHLADLKEQVADFHRTHHYSVVVDEQTQPGYCLFCVAGVKPLPTGWGILIGDFAHNARSALDHLTWQLVLLNGGRPDGNTMFPIFKVLDDYRKSDRGPKMIRGVASSVREKIEALQPYQRGDRAVDDPLWLLNVLSNIDKHRTLHVVRSAGVRTEFAINEMEGFDIPELSLFTPSVIEEGAVVASMRLVRTGEKGKLHADPRFAFEERFGEGSEDLTGRGVGETLESIRDHVSDTVFDQFRPLF